MCVEFAWNTFLTHFSGGGVGVEGVCVCWRWGVEGRAYFADIETRKLEPLPRNEGQNL